jgi:hypothetical protein
MVINSQQHKDGIDRNLIPTFTFKALRHGTYGTINRVSHHGQRCVMLQRGSMILWRSKSRNATLSCLLTSCYQIKKIPSGQWTEMRYLHYI